MTLTSEPVGTLDPYALRRAFPRAISTRSMNWRITSMPRPRLSARSRDESRHPPRSLTTIATPPSDRVAASSTVLSPKR